MINIIVDWCSGDSEAAAVTSTFQVGEAETGVFLEGLHFFHLTDHLHF
jgi:hypothetical protein